MKKMLLLTLSIFVATAVAASASTCTSDPLSTYDAAGFSCTLGDLTFSDFTYVGALAPPDSGVEVTPVSATIGSVSETGLEFTAPWLVGPGGTEDSSITFNVGTTNPGGITDIYLNVVGGATGSGVASVAETTNTTPPQSLFTEFASGVTISTDTATFAPVGSLTVYKDIGLVGGSGMSGAHISDVYNLFSEGTSMVPEPSLTLLCLCALGIVPLARRRFIH